MSRPRVLELPNSDSSLNLRSGLSDIQSASSNQVEHVSDVPPTTTRSTPQPLRRLWNKSRSKSSSNLQTLAQVDMEEMQSLIGSSGLSQAFVEEKFSQFTSLTDMRPERGMTSKQFYKHYQRAYPRSVQPLRLANSLFRWLDQDHDGILYFREFFTAFCVPSAQQRLSTRQKYQILFHIWDHLELGYLTPGSVAIIMKDVYDILGLSSDYHHEAIELFGSLDTDGDCRIFEDDFVHGMMTNTKWVSRMETCNFCFPKEDTYLGQSAFWEL